MGSGLITVLPIALAIIMAGLGLELTINDFKRVRQHPKAVFIALFCQLVILVGIAFIICKVLALPPMLAVGLMLLSASPGGPTANLFSYLYRFKYYFNGYKFGHCCLYTSINREFRNTTLYGKWAKCRITIL